MTLVTETAYPRLKKRYSSAELEAGYTLSESEKNFVFKNSYEGSSSRLALAVLLKTCTHTGRVMRMHEIPSSVIDFLSRQAGCQEVVDFRSYNRSGARLRHLKLIREYLNIRPLDQSGREDLYREAFQAALTKERLADIINVMLEILVRNRCELPGFSVLDRMAAKARRQANEHWFGRVFQALPQSCQDELKALFEEESEAASSHWQHLKTEPEKPSAKRIRDFVAYYRWLKPLKPPVDLIRLLPSSKYLSFAYQALSLDFALMKRLPSSKRVTLAAVLLDYRFSGASDDLTLMFIKLMRQINSQAKRASDEHFLKERSKIHRIISTFSDFLSADNQEQTVGEALGENREEMKQYCEEYFAGNTGSRYPFLMKVFLPKRAVLFNITEELSLHVTGKDDAILQCKDFICRNRRHRKEWTEASDIPSVDWLPEQSRKYVTGKSVKQTKVDKVHGKYFEIAVFSELSKQLQSLDMYVEGGRDYADYRRQLIDNQTLSAEKQSYAEMIGIPETADLFVQMQQEKLRDQQQLTDTSFPKNERVSLEQDRLIIHRSAAKSRPAQYAKVNDYLLKNMKPVSITDVLTDTEKMQGLHTRIGPLSGYEPKIDQVPQRLIASLFCFGCNLGVTETARSLEGFSRKQIAWLNRLHLSETHLEKALTQIINSYNEYELPLYWGRGESASADGTKWDLHENNLFSEYHIRYGGYGGIGYYHVADNYIALFSRFIPCGVYEATHILDGLLENESDIQPDKLHGDTHSQSETVFALAYLLGIKLMPRIRSLNALTLYSADGETEFKHIEGIKTDYIDWALIEAHFEEMLRVALSVKKGKIRASAVLARLGVRNRKNRLYFAFRELGRAIRSQFIFEYIRDEKLRTVIRAETLKSEEYNAFTKWIAFGNKGVIAESRRYEQQKVIKYNQLVANMIILYNVNEMSRLLNELIAEGCEIEEETLQALSPYRTQHIQRFGTYRINVDREKLRVQTKITGVIKRKSDDR